MSQQINLYEERLRPRHELATGRNLAVGVLVVIVAMTALSLWTQFDARRKGDAAASIRKELTTAQERLSELSKAQAERKVSPALISERDSVKAVLAQRQEIMAVLESGRLGTTSGFSAVMTGFARQTLSDLWLTGFAVTMGGDEIEIRGRLFDPAKLPGYVQNLSQEPVFRGRRFAALEMHDVDPDVQNMNPSSSARTSTDGTALNVVPAGVPRFVEFVLRSENGGSADTAGEGAKP